MLKTSAGVPSLKQKSNHQIDKIRKQIDSFNIKVQKDILKKHRNYIKRIKKYRKHARKERKNLLEGILFCLHETPSTPSYLYTVYTKKESFRHLTSIEEERLRITRWFLGLWAKQNIPQVCGFIHGDTCNKLILFFDKDKFQDSVNSNAYPHVRGDKYMCRIIEKYYAPEKDPLLKYRRY